MENCLGSAAVRCQGFAALLRERLLGRERRTDLLALCRPACHLVISTNSSGAAGTGMYREWLRLPISDEPIGSSVASGPGELPIVECDTGTALCHCLNDTAS